MRPIPHARPLPRAVCSALPHSASPCGSVQQSVSRVARRGGLHSRACVYLRHYITPTASHTPSHRHLHCRRPQSSSACCDAGALMVRPPALSFLSLSAMSLLATAWVVPLGARGPLLLTVALRSNSIQLLDRKPPAGPSGRGCSGAVLVDHTTPSPTRAEHAHRCCWWRPWMRWWTSGAERGARGIGCGLALCALLWLRAWLGDESHEKSRQRHQDASVRDEEQVLRAAPPRSQPARCTQQPETLSRITSQAVSRMRAHSCQLRVSLCAAWRRSISAHALAVYSLGRMPDPWARGFGWDACWHPNEQAENACAVMLWRQAAHSEHPQRLYDQNLVGTWAPATRTLRAQTRAKYV